jgi:uncharacterized membrane protein YoaK (UPF0700 family)
MIDNHTAGARGGARRERWLRRSPVGRPDTYDAPGPAVTTNIRTANVRAPSTGHNVQVTAARSHGPLPLLLVALTVVTGLVDAFSYLRLGHVFVANMTGNVVFLGFGLAGAGDVSIEASLVAIVAFAVGATVGGRWALRQPPHRGHLLAVAAATQATLVAGAAVIAEFVAVRDLAARLTLISVLAVAMGGQNAVARRLAVPDLTTTVLTMTVTGLVADAISSSARLRRLVPILAMLGGAVVGGALLRWVRLAAPLWLAAAVLVCCAATAWAAAGRAHSDEWH